MISFFKNIFTADSKEGEEGRRLFLNPEKTDSILLKDPEATFKEVLIQNIEILHKVLYIRNINDFNKSYFIALKDKDPSNKIGVRLELDEKVETAMKERGFDVFVVENKDVGSQETKSAGYRLKRRKRGNSQRFRHSQVFKQGESLQ